MLIGILSFTGLFQQFSETNDEKTTKGEIHELINKRKRRGNENNNVNFNS